MNNSISIVMSKKIYSNSSAKMKAFIASFSIHLMLFAMLLHYNNRSELVLMPVESKSIVVSLTNYVSTKKVLKEPIHQIPKQIHKVKKIKKVAKVKKIKKVVKVKKKALKTIQKQKTPEKAQPESVVPSEAFTPLTKKDVKPATQEEVTHQKTSNVDSPLADSSLSQQTRPVEVSNEKLARIRYMIQNSLRYPAIARKLKIEGVVLISFSLSKDGHINSLSLLKSSGSSTLDQRALQTVSLLDGEYPPLSKKVDLKIPISFSLHQS